MKLALFGMVAFWGSSFVFAAPIPAKVTLILFGAPPCQVCRNELPQIETIFESIPASEREGLKLNMIVETGASWTDAPNQHIAAEFANALKLSLFDPITDTSDAHGRPSWESFTRYTGIPLTEAAVPAGVLLDSSANVTDVFRAGDTSFAPESIVDTTMQRLRSSY